LIILIILGEEYKLWSSSLNVVSYKHTQRFGVIYSLHLQCRRLSQSKINQSQMEVIYPSEAHGLT
jgi:hypothetical protein